VVATAAAGARAWCRWGFQLILLPWLRPAWLARRAALVFGREVITALSNDELAPAGRILRIPTRSGHALDDCPMRWRSSSVPARTCGPARPTAGRSQPARGSLEAALADAEACCWKWVFLLAPHRHAAWPSWEGVLRAPRWAVTRWPLFCADGERQLRWASRGQTP